MKRWFWKRWLWAVLVGTTATVGITLAQIGKDTTSWPPKIGDTITLPFEQGPKQVKVLKTEKQPDGSYLCEVRDSKSGETFNLLERQPSSNPHTPAASQPARTNPRVNDPVVPPLPPGKDTEKSRVTPPGNTSSKDKTTTSQKPEEERPGLLKRLFSRKKPAEPDASAMPATTSARPPMPSMAPAIRPNPSLAGTTSEPPRTLPIRPVTPPTPAIPAPVAIPSAPPVTPPSAIPTPIPIPSVPVVPPAGGPGSGGLPPIPIPPNGVSAAKPMPLTQHVVPAGREVPAPTQPVVHPDIKSHAEALKKALAPSQRALAARAMCCSQHSSTDVVKKMIFDAAQHDPCPMVRAVCIEELCKLGYHETAFMTFVEKACNDKSDEVKTAAKAAMMKMTPQR